MGFLLLEAAPLGFGCAGLGSPRGPVHTVDAPDCPGAVLAWAAQVTRLEDYGLSPRLLDESPPGTGCGLRWFSPLDGAEPDADPASPARMQLRRVLGLGYEITDYRPLLTWALPSPAARRVDAYEPVAQGCRRER